MSKEQEEDEFVLLEDYSVEYGKIVVIDNDDHSIYAFILDAETQEIEFDAYICSLSEPFENEEDVQDLIDLGFAPAITYEFASDEAVIPDALQKQFEARWIEDGWLEILLDGNLITLIDLDEEQSYCKSIAEDGPYGYEFKDELIEG